MSLYRALFDLEASGRVAALCTIVRERGSVPRHAGSKMLVYADGHVLDTIGGGEMESRVVRVALEVMADGRPRTVGYQLADPSAGDPGVCGGEVEIFVEPIQPRLTLLVIGAGHVGRALVHLGHWLGFRVALADDRPEYCTPEWAPGADEYLCVPARQLPAHFAFTPQTYIVMPTRGAAIDVDALPALLDVPHAYLGVIGSRRRWATAERKLREAGVPAEKLARVVAPMGLELQAETPEEIAVSIAAEIIMLARRGTGEPMRVTQDSPAAAGPQAGWTAATRGNCLCGNRFKALPV